MKRSTSTAASPLFKIGLRIRRARRKKNMTLADIARGTGLSKGLLSKVENFRALPSLPVLAEIARCLGIGMEDIVKGIGAGEAPRCQLVPASGRTPMRREPSRGFKYEAILSRPLGGVGFEAFVLTLAPGARRKPLATEGGEFIFMLRGNISFDVGRESFLLRAGDAFYFDGRVPHVPRNTSGTPAELLVVYLLRQQNRKGNHEDF